MKSRRPRRAAPRHRQQHVVARDPTSVTASLDNAQIHSDLLRTRVVSDFAEMFPERFNCKTNGITPRRWLYQANPRLPAVSGAMLPAVAGHPKHEERHLARLGLTVACCIGPDHTGSRPRVSDGPLYRATVSVSRAPTCSAT